MLFRVTNSVKALKAQYKTINNYPNNCYDRQDKYTQN